MAITIFHRVINNNHIRIINNRKKPEKKALKVSADIKTIRHTITEVKEYER